MASIREQDLTAVGRQLTAWLRDVAGLDGAEVDDLRMPDTGAVNDTFVYTVRWAGGTETQVLRAEPRGYSNLRDNDVLEQARFLERLGAVSDLPVPRVRWIDEDGGPFERPLYVMDAIPGEPVPDMPPYALRGWLHDLPAERQRAVYRQAVESLAAVHAVPAGSLGVASGGTLDAVVGEFVAFAEWGAAGDDYPTLDAAAAWLRANQPASGDAVLVWNDGRLGNMLFDGGTLRGLLDWELVTIGPPELDLAWFLWHDHFSAACLASVIAGHPVPRLPGSPGRDEAVGWYVAAGGRPPEDLRWFETWSAYRMAVYLMRHGKGLIETGQAPADSGVDRVNIASVELASMLGLDPPR